MRAIIVEGASTAYGMDAGEYGGWAAQLHRDRQAYNANNRYDPDVVINRALPGLTLPYFNRHADATLSPIVHGTQGRATRVLSVGVNEAKIMPDMPRPIITLGRFALELTEYAEFNAKNGLAAVYVGAQPIIESRVNKLSVTGATLEDDLLEDYAELTRQHAQDTGMPFVDVRKLFEAHDLHSVLADDGCHPNAKGHQIIHAGVQSALDTLGFNAHTR